MLIKTTTVSQDEEVLPSNVTDHQVQSMAPSLPDSRHLPSFSCVVLHMLLRSGLFLSCLLVGVMDTTFLWV